MILPVSFLGRNPEFILQGASYLPGKIFQENNRFRKKFFIVAINNLTQKSAAMMYLVLASVGMYNRICLK